MRRKALELARLGEWESWRTAKAWTPGGLPRLLGRPSREPSVDQIAPSDGIVRLEEALKVSVVLKEKASSNTAVKCVEDENIFW